MMQMDYDAREARKLLEVLWSYNILRQEPEGADILIVMGTNDIGVPLYAAALEKKFSYRWIVTTGGVFHQKALHGQAFGETEAVHFKKIMVEQGVNPGKIIVENGAKNTGDNVTLTKAVLRDKGADFQTGHLVHTPSMERRALATAEKQWPEMKWSVSSQPVSLEVYLEGLNEKNFIEGLVGDTFRILDYPAKGFQSPQGMPREVRAALASLIDMGFRKRIPADIAAKDVLHWPSS